MEDDAILTDQQRLLVMQELRKLYFKDEAFSTVYAQDVKRVGVDMAQRRRRSIFRTHMARCFGHPVVADVLVIKGFWSKDIQDRLVEERGHRRTAGGPEPSKPPPTAHRTKTGRKKVYGAAKVRKREKYYARVAEKERLEE